MLLAESSIMNQQCTLNNVSSNRNTQKHKAELCIGQLMKTSQRNLDPVFPLIVMVQHAC